MEAHAPERPALTPGLPATEFLRWYWLKDELTGLARSMGLGTTGGKETLTQRIAAALDGREFTEPAPARRPAGRQLAEPLRGNTCIPPGQRCSQVLRKWLAERIGPAFHFDAPMRQFLAEADGTQTLDDAVARWRGSRGAGQREIDPQFEYNRFTRAWHAANPAGSRVEMLEAWNNHRSRPRW